MTLSTTDIIELIMVSVPGQSEVNVLKVNFFVKLIIKIIFCLKKSYFKAYYSGVYNDALTTFVIIFSDQQ